MAAVKLLLADVAAAASGRDAAADLAKRSGTSKRKAQSVLDAAKKVKSQPAVEDAVRNGELSGEQAELIADAAAVNPAPRPAAGGRGQDRIARRAEGRLRAGQSSRRP